MSDVMLEGAQGRDVGGHARSRLALEREVGLPQSIAIDVVQERGEPFLLLYPCGSPYALEAVGRALPARRPGRAVHRSLNEMEAMAETTYRLDYGFLP